MIRKFKKGAASFYIVAFSTLILMIVAISFAAVIISEVERTSNDDLSQSAYDSAIAGIEDAKLAYYNYLNCKVNESNDASNNAENDTGEINCNTILGLMDENDDKSIEEECGMVWAMLGRNDDVAGNVVETNTGNNMQQAITCLIIRSNLSDYIGSLSSSRMMDVIKPKFGDKDTVIDSNEIGRIVLRWYSKDDVSRSGLKWSESGLKFPAVSERVIAPPVISFTMLQTGQEFTMDSFNDVDTYNNKTNRGMVYLMPTKSNRTDPMTIIPKETLVKSNAKTGGDNQNEPVAIECDENGEYVCSATIVLPQPVGDSKRNNDTFEIIVGIPYGQPATDFMLEFYCGENGDAPCGQSRPNTESTSESERSSLATLDGVQLEIDSTGRANDLYRRVITRLKNVDDFALSIMGPLELIGRPDDNSYSLEKDMSVTKEYNFND